MSPEPGEIPSRPANQPKVSVTGFGNHSAARSAIPHTTRVRVLLVDDHMMVRQGLRALFDAYDDVELVAIQANLRVRA